MFSVRTAHMRAMTLKRGLNQSRLRFATHVGRTPGGLPNAQGPLTATPSPYPHTVQPNDPIDASNLQSLPGSAEMRPLRILSLDGGGVRGFSSLLILQELMARLEKATGKSVLPADFFDLIIGTSTGGIMALMLGRLRMNVDDAIDMYSSLSDQIFGTGRVLTALHTCMTLVMDGVPSMYNEAALEKYVKETVAKLTKDRDPEALLEDLSPNSCKTAVVTTRSVDATRPILKRSYPIPYDPDLEKFKIWEAARATSAAPIYFRPVTAGVHKAPYLDGCVSGHSNPSWLAMQEAKLLWPDRKIGLFLSLGTGSPKAVALQAPLREFLLGFAYLSASTVQVHERAERDFERKYKDSPYVRLSVDHEISHIRLDDASRLDDISEATLAYLDVARTTGKLQRFVNLATEQIPSKQPFSPSNLQSPEEEEEDTLPPPRFRGSLPTLFGKYPTGDSESMQHDSLSRQ